MNIEPSESRIQALVELGFTPVEAEVYLFLMGTSPASGYRIAQAVGRPAAQVYRALDGLGRKGAILTAEGKTRLCRPVPPEVCLSTLEQGFAARKARAAEVLRDLPAPSNDERVYRLDSRDQVIEQARTMLRDAEQIALLDLFPAPLRDLRADVEAMAERGVRTAVKLYESTPLKGIELLVVPRDAPRVLTRWRGQQINIVVDGRAFLWAMLSRDDREVLYAFWSANRYLAAMGHNGLGCELPLSHIIRAIREGKSGSQLEAVVAECEPFFLTNSPALNAMSLPDEGAE